VANILTLLSNDPQDPQQLALKGLAKLAGSRAAIGKEQAMRLASRMLAYPELDKLLKSIVAIVEENDGVDASGRPNAERDLLREDLAAASTILSGLARPAAGSGATSASTSPLLSALLEPIQLRGGQQVGAPAWAVRTDANANPKVMADPSTGRLYAPFIDQNRDGICDVNSALDPIDATGGEIDLEPFGSTGARDADGRALATDGKPIYDYFDAKQTALAQTLLIAGELLRQDVPLDLLQAIDACSTRIARADASGAFTGYADDNPLTDLAWGGLEIFRYRDAPKLLDSLAALIKNDPARAERLMVSLVNVIGILERTQLSGGQGTQKLVDDLVPVLSKVFTSSGGGQAGADQLATNLLDTFRTEIQRVRGIPRGLAGMMKYAIYPGTDPVNPNGLPTSPGHVSCMEQLMNMMAEANQCDSWPFGNMANFYLDAMAGNKVINLYFFSITINVHTINQLLNVSALRSLLCNKISPDNILSLQAFADSGALDALIPIVKAFSDRGQTDLIKNIFLTLGANYPTALRANEGVVVQILESGMVEQLFDALNVLAGMTVPSTGEPVTTVTAQFIAALVDVNRGVRDRHGNPQISLLHLLVKPLSAMQDRIDQRGVRAQYDRAIHALIDTTLATTTITTGTSQNPVQESGLLYQGLVKVTAGLLQTLSSSMSMDPATRNADITSYEGDLVSLMTGRNIPLLVDNLLAVQRSPSRQLIVDAMVNVFTPNLAVRNDIFGSVLEVAAAALQAKADPTATVDVLHFAGEVLDPARGWSKPLALALVKLVSGQANTTILTIAKNALDRGPAGNARSPAETLLSILDDIQAASLAGSQPLSAQSIADSAKKIADFIRDKDHGLEAIYTQMIGHAR
ncbi:MAG TPA: hypothetical protein VHF22_16070, partial [Planctomycetota bacterium]|nr:hypothetical protein [Planctomycetota bacterium]